MALWGPTIGGTLCSGRGRAIFDCCKWNNQCDDRPLLCSFPLVLDDTVWNEVARLASQLAQEMLAAESELLDRADLHDDLGLPCALRHCLRRVPRTVATLAGPRVVRFDFHWTTKGWRISEANTDVAGGFVEASGVTRLFAACYPGCLATGDPAGVLAKAIQGKIRARGRVGLLHVNAHLEDRQTILYLRNVLRSAEFGHAHSALPNSGGGLVGSRPLVTGTTGRSTCFFDSSPLNGFPVCLGRRVGGIFLQAAARRSAILAMRF